MADECIPALEGARKAAICMRCGSQKTRNRCKQCHAAYMKVWRAENLEKCKESKRKSYQRHKDSIEDRRRIKSAENREAKSAQRRAYYEKNKDRIKAAARARKEAGLIPAESIAKEKMRIKAWLAANVERVRERGRNAYHQNRAAFARRAKRWRLENPEKCAAHSRNRRAKKSKMAGSHTADDIASIRKMQLDRCACCKTALKGRGQVDHIVAVANGGSDDRRNLQLLCKPCNSSKGAADPIEFMQRRGKLL